MTRPDGRDNDELRPTTITCGVQAFPEGSVLIETGMTRVLCAVSVEDEVPRFLRGSGARVGNGRVRHASARLR